MKCTFIPTQPRHSASRAGGVFTWNADTLVAGATQTVYLQFPARLPADVATTAFVLSLMPSASSAADAGQTWLVELLDWTGPNLANGVESANVAASVTIDTSAAWTAGTRVALSLAGLASACVNRDAIVLRISRSAGSVSRTFGSATVFDAWPQIELTFTTATGVVDDPFTPVVECLWALLEREPAFCHLVPVGNRIRYINDLDRRPEKENVMAADLPEVVIRPEGGPADWQASSSTSRIDLTFAIDVSTGDRRLSVLMFPLWFAIFRALRHWQYAFAALKWNAAATVVQMRSDALTTGLDAEKFNRGVIGWVTLWRVTVEMQFETARL